VVHNTWKCHNEILCIGILNKQKCLLLSKMVDRNVNRVLSGGWYKWEGEDIKEGCRRVNMVEIVCTHV
jgi:hypothetical protein